MAKVSRMQPADVANNTWPAQPPPSAAPMHPRCPRDAPPTFGIGLSLFGIFSAGME